MLPGVQEQRLSGWGNLAAERSPVYQPERLADLQGTIQSHGATLISRGLGRSYGDAAINAGGVVSHLRLNRLLAFDEQRGIVECEAGVTFDDLLRVALPRGFFPSVTPGTKHVTVGGAIAADVHGKNHHVDGSFADCLLSFRLLTASGEMLHCSRTENAPVFWATLGGMGLTGALVDSSFDRRHRRFSRPTTKDRPISTRRWKPSPKATHNIATRWPGLIVSPAAGRWAVRC
jgi:decaprenylphospho-beta-D-ribofuranose 2-oxidase